MTQPTLSLSGQARHDSVSLKDRQKHPRLNGADLYVARLGWSNGEGKEGHYKMSHKASNRQNSLEQSLDPAKRFRESKPSSTSSASSSPSHTSASDLPTLVSSATSPSQPLMPPIAFRELSLHDELVDPHPRRRPAMSSPADSWGCALEDHSSINASRPCYRCIAYMHSVGIRRAFWTNERGEWEGGKVRDLIDAMEGSMARGVNGEAVVGGPMGNGLFVTKHEVLMLRRLMGQG